MHTEDRYIIVYSCPTYTSKQENLVFKTREEAQYHVDELNLHCKGLNCYGIEKITVVVKDN